MSKAIKKTKKTINQSTLRTKATRVLNQVREIDYNMPYKLMHIQQTIEDLNKRKFESIAQLKDEYSDFLFWTHKVFVIIQNRISDVQHDLEHLRRGE